MNPAEHARAMARRFFRLHPRLHPDKIRRRVRRIVGQGFWSAVRGPVSAAEIRDGLERVGIKAGTSLFVHSSLEGMYGFNGTPLSLVRTIIDLVGPAGTVAMPAFPTRFDADILFDVRRTPTGAGLIAETFRRMPNVERSINLFHSVCALGPQAKFITSDHHKSPTAWDRNSPYFRLAEIDATIVTIGLPKSFGLGTSMHCPESILYDEIPYFRKVFGAPLTYRYRDAGGQYGTHEVRPRQGDWKPNRIRRHFDRRKIRVVRVGGIRIQAVPARYLIEHMVELARRGIVNYRMPEPRREYFPPSKPRREGG